MSSILSVELSLCQYCGAATDIFYRATYLQLYILLLFFVSVRGFSYDLCQMAVLDF